MNRNPFAVHAFPFWVFAVLVFTIVLAGCGGEEPTPTPTAVPTALPTATIRATAAATTESTAALPTPRAASVPQASTSATVTATAPVTASLTATATASVTPCLQPAGWFTYEIQEGDSLIALAIRSGVMVEELARANCLSDDTIIAGRSLLLPVDLRLTPTPCALPSGWIIYTVVANDTLSELAALTGASVEEIQQSNCLPDTVIVEGRPLYLPVAPARRVAAASTPARVAAGAASGAAEVDAEAGDFLAAPPALAPSDAGVAAPDEGAVIGQESTNSATGATIPIAENPSPFGQLTEGFGARMEASDPAPGVQCPPAVGSPFRVFIPPRTEPFEIGETLVFYACNPVKPDGPLKAAVRLVGLSYSPTWWAEVQRQSPDDDPDSAHSRVIWHVTPDLPASRYQLVVEDSGGHQSEPLTFTVQTPTEPRVLIIPGAGYVGRTGFTIYLVNVAEDVKTDCPNVAVQAVEFDPEDPFNCLADETQARAGLCVQVNQSTNGVNWGSYPFVSAPDDPPGCYGFRYKGGQENSTVVLLPLPQNQRGSD